jgi:serine protease Do
MQTTFRITLFAALIAVTCASSSVAAPDATKAAANTNVIRGYLLSPKAFRAAVAKVRPSLVTIESFGGVAISPGAKVGKRTQSSGISKPGEGPTTGLIVSADGHIITSTFNFLRNPPIITVTLSDGSQYVAKMLGRDETRKLCMLKIEVDHALPTPELVSREELRVGQWAISLGVGYGDSEPAISAGIISATHRISQRAVQTDANISPANYGGPLIDITGRVIGICSPLSPSQNAPKRPGKPKGGVNKLAGVEWYDSGIGFAVPLAGAERMIEKLKKGETVVSGTVGVILKPTKDGGAIITGIAPNSPAATAKLEKNDIIIAADGEKIHDILHLRAVVGRFAAGEEMSLTIKRGDKDLEVKVTLIAASKLKKAPPKKANPTKKAKPAEKKQPANAP